MSRNWRYISGDWNAICDSCGKKLKASQLKKRWDGMMVCQDDFEQRHPQDFIRARQDKIAVPFTRPISDTHLPIYGGVSDSYTGVSDNLSYTATYHRSLADTYLSTDIAESLSYYKTFGISESFSTFSDSFTTATTFSRSVTDALSSPTESISYNLLTPQLNGAALNTFTLG